jgi:hypothetical protein
VKESSPQFSAGVQTMQQRLAQCGYNLGSGGADGLFGQTTENVVKSFQTECKLTSDGQAGTGTLTQLDKVYTVDEFKTYGKPLTTSQWGQTYILGGNVNDADLLARIIWGEDRASVDAQAAVAKVIKNRSTSDRDDLVEKAADYPSASVWARVVGYKKNGNIQYATASSGSASKTPTRGDYTKTDGLDIYWKNAVSLGKKLSQGTTFTTPNGYVLNHDGSTSSSKTGVVSGQLWQGVSSQYSATSYNGVKFSNVVGQGTVVFNKSGD